MGEIRVGVRDKGGEIGRFTLPVPEPTAIGAVGDIALMWDDFAPLIAALTLGTYANVSAVYDQQEDGTTPASNFAQREFGLRVYLVGDADSRTFTITIPTVDADAVTLQEGSDLVVLADAGPVAALVAEMEQTLRYPSEGGGLQTVTVNRAAIVGRNS